MMILKMRMALKFHWSDVDVLPFGGTFPIFVSCIFIRAIFVATVWWFRNLANQLRLVVYPIIFPVFFWHFGWWIPHFPRFLFSQPFPQDFWLRESSGPKTTRKMLAAPQHSDFQHSRFQEVDPSNGLSVSCISTRPELKTLQEKHTTNELVYKEGSFLNNWGFLLHSFGEVVSKKQKKWWNNAGTWPFFNVKEGDLCLAK